MLLRGGGRRLQGVQHDAAHAVGVSTDQHSPSWCWLVTQAYAWMRTAAERQAAYQRHVGIVRDGDQHMGDGAAQQVEAAGEEPDQHIQHLAGKGTWCCSS